MNYFPSYPTFGPGGNGDWFRRDGMKSMLQTPGWLDRVGLDAFEYEATRGVSAGEESLLAFGQKAREQVHTMEDLEVTLQEALDWGHGYVIECIIDTDEMVRPMVGGGSPITKFIID